MKIESFSLNRDKAVALAFEILRLCEVTTLCGLCGFRKDEVYSGPAMVAPMYPLQRGPRPPEPIGADW